jgi:hypothetical protein
MLSESEFLALCAGIGLDWTTPLGELKARHGVRRWFDFTDVVNVPLGNLTPSIGGVFYVHYRPQDEPWPCDTYVWERIARRDVMGEQAALSEELVCVFGPGEKHRATNVVGRTWETGLFRVEIRTFLKPKEDLFGNTLYARHPELWNCTTVTLQTRHFAFAPDESLARFATLPDLLTAPERVASSWQWFAPLIRRSPDALKASLPKTRVALRRDEDTGTIAIAGQELSLIFDRRCCSGLVLVRAAPERGPGYAAIEVDYRHPLAHGNKRTITLFRASQTKALDDLAPRVAEALKLRLKTVNGYDG